MDRLRHLIVVAGLLALVGCKAEQPKKRKAVTGRFAAVKKEARVDKAAASFCEVTFSASDAHRWKSPPERPVPDQPATKATAKAWTWVNLWASWCGPCIEEMPLLQRWKKALAAEKLPIDMQLWSIDEEPEDLMASIAERKLPGTVRWLRSLDDLQPLLDGLGVSRGSAIPIHALVDPAGNLRCVRVGKVGEESYGQVRTIIAGG